VSFQLFIFYVFAIIMVFAALRVITVRNPVYAAMFLVLTFFTASAIWMLLEAEFLAVTLVLVYVGAVMVLFLFVVSEGFVKYLPAGILVGSIMFLEMVFLLTQRYFPSDNFPAPAPKAADHSNTEELGRLLYSDYLFHFDGGHSSGYRIDHAAPAGHQISKAWFAGAG